MIDCTTDVVDTACLGSVFAILRRSEDLKKKAAHFFFTMTLIMLGTCAKAADSPTWNQPSALDLSSLQKSQKITVYLISSTAHPGESDAFHGYPIVGKVTFTSPECKQAILECLNEAIDFGYSQQLCFSPHHAIRACIDGKNDDFVICFECCQAREYVDGSKAPVQTYTVSPYYGTVLNVMLKSKEPTLMTKARLVGYKAIKDKKVGELIVPLDLLRAEKWKDETTGHEVEFLDFSRTPKALKPIEEGHFLKSDEFLYSQ